MKNNDFRYMRGGKQIASLDVNDLPLLQPIDKRGPGKEHALLLLHGFSSSPAVYRYLIPQIKHYDAIVCPVLPGHAESITAFSKVKASEWLETADAACASLINEYQKVDVLGLSLGGLLACSLAQKFTLNHLYLLAPALKLEIRAQFMLGLAKLLHYLGFHHLRNEAGNLLNTEHAEIAYRKLPLNAVIEILQMTQNYQWTPPNCPVDLFLGAHDLIVDSKSVEDMYIPFPHVTIHWLRNSAHVLPLDNDLDQIVECINRNIQ